MTGTPFAKWPTNIISDDGQVNCHTNPLMSGVANSLPVVTSHTVIWP